MFNNTIRTLAIVASAAVATGCSSLAADESSANAGSELVSAEQLHASQQRVSELESALAAQNNDLATARANMTTSNVSDLTSGDASLFPPNPMLCTSPDSGAVHHRV